MKGVLRCSISNAPIWRESLRGTGTVMHAWRSGRLVIKLNIYNYLGSTGGEKMGTSLRESGSRCKERITLGILGFALCIETLELGVLLPLWI